MPPVPAAVRRLLLAAALALALALAAPGAAGAVSFEFRTIGAPGNAPDDQVVTCCFTLRGTTDQGAVDYVYRMAAHEVTNAQYVEFLNAVAKSDPNALWNFRMGGEDAIGIPGGIVREGSDGAYSYAPMEGFAERPVRFLDLYRGARFANWLHNGQPVGEQGPGTTEDGAYELLGENPLDLTREPDARYFVPTRDEWYKAAYYDPVTDDYYLYPTGTDDPVQSAIPPGDDNSANITTFDLSGCPRSAGPCKPIAVGSYPATTSPFGLYDMAGNIYEFTETWDVPERPEQIVILGSSYKRGYKDSNTTRLNDMPALCDNCSQAGFRIATTVPEPGSSLLVTAALLTLEALRGGRLAAAGARS